MDELVTYSQLYIYHFINLYQATPHLGLMNQLDLPQKHAWALLLLLTEGTICKLNLFLFCDALGKFSGNAVSNCKILSSTEVMSFTPSLIFSSFSVKMILWNIHYMCIYYSNCMVSDSMIYILLLIVKLRNSLLPQIFTKWYCQIILLFCSSKLLKLHCVKYLQLKVSFLYL